MRNLFLCIILIIPFLFSSCSQERTKHEKSVVDSNENAQSNINWFPDMSNLWEADSLAYLYWGHPSSPYRNDSQYVVFLDSLLKLSPLPETLRLRAEERRRVVLLNGPGNVANNFSFISREGNKSSLNAFTAKSAKPEVLTLLIFYDPECTHCSDILDVIASDPNINEAIELGNLSVLAIYAEGKRDIWESSKSKMAANWTVGYDLTGVLDRELYDLPAMPTLYLLDTRSRVILKDPDVNYLLQLFEGVQIK